MYPLSVLFEVDDGGWAQLATWREWAADFARYRALLPEQVRPGTRYGIHGITRSDERVRHEPCQRRATIHN